MNAISIPKDYKYLYKTRDGYEITDVFQDRYGYLAIVFKRNLPGAEMDWCNAKSYDPATGRWNGGGMYMMDTRLEAIDNLFDRVDGGLTAFDPTNLLDVHHEYNSQYNWNRVDKEYLMSHDHRSPSFDTFTNRSLLEEEEHPFDTRAEWEAWKRDVYRKENWPNRVESYNLLGGKYAKRRQALKFWERRR